MSEYNGWENLDTEKIASIIQNTKGKVVLGFDGIIDQVWQILESRIDKDEYKIMNKMKQFGELIVERGEGGMANEIIQKRRCSGGFTANTGRALINLNFDTVMMGMYGEETIDPVFNEFIDRCALISLGEPAVGNIFEFEDGKIMMPHLESMLYFDWKNLLSRLDMGELKKLFQDAGLISIGYWSNMPDFNNIISNICDKLIDRGVRMFFDFANISKRSESDLRDTLELLGRLNERNPMTLSLNKHEAVLLFNIYDENYGESIVEIMESIDRLREKIKLDEIVIHTPYYALASTSTELTTSKQDYCASPVKTTGAGDTFNAGYIASHLYKLDLKERLAVANAATSFYLKNALPPTEKELLGEFARIKATLA